MTRIEAAFEKLLGEKWLREPWLGDARAYVASGEPAKLARVKPADLSWMLRDLEDAMATPPSWSEEDRRALHVLAKAECELNRWLERAIAGEADGEDRFGLVRTELASAGLDGAALGLVAVRSWSALACEGRPTSLGRYLLALPDRDLGDVVQEAVRYDGDYGETAKALPHLLDLLLERAPERVHALRPPSGGPRSGPRAAPGAGPRSGASRRSSSRR